ncbi:hypothetical protein [Neolewinella persica]|uniref:hypothetical protein n=1 Tax=Neolewinella persica TaxID=70998 RepID=UPI00037F99EF|nr:hypothetical protein [Neolewinella persica]
MMKMIGQAIASLFGELFSVWFLGGFLKFVHGVGVRIYSLFVGTRKTPVAELRGMYEDLMLPWLIGFSIFGTVFYFGFVWLLF